MTFPLPPNPPSCQRRPPQENDINPETSLYHLRSSRWQMAAKKQRGNISNLKNLQVTLTWGNHFFSQNAVGMLDFDGFCNLNLFGWVVLLTCFFHSIHWLSRLWGTTNKIPVQLSWWSNNDEYTLKNTCRREVKSTKRMGPLNLEVQEIDCYTSGEPRK